MFSPPAGKMAKEFVKRACKTIFLVSACGGLFITQLHTNKISSGYGALPSNIFKLYLILEEQN